LASCAECDDLPCTRLIQFANDPIWRTHLPVLENLRRIQRIGVEAWLDERVQGRSSHSAQLANLLSAVQQR